MNETNMMSYECETFLHFRRFLHFRQLFSREHQLEMKSFSSTNLYLLSRSEFNVFLDPLTVGGHSFENLSLILNVCRTSMEALMSGMAILTYPQVHMMSRVTARLSIVFTFLISRAASWLEYRTLMVLPEITLTTSKLDQNAESPAKMVASD
jgi:hypothetical protein